MTTDDELLRSLSEALAPDDRQPPQERVAALSAAVADRPAISVVSGPLPIRSVPRWRRVATAVAAVAAAFALGGIVLDNHPSQDLLADGVIEFESTLVAPDGDAQTTVVGIRTGIGRVVQLRTDDLPILPTGEMYEVWFVGPGDTATSPNRISAGTFHPDEQGRSHVDLTAAVDPELYPELSITAEPGDGDPSPTGAEVLRASITLDPPR